MPEYIEREALKEHLMSYAGMFTDELGFVVKLQAVLNGIDFQPAADVVAVVRCKDCKWRRAKLAGDSWHEGEVFMHRCEQLGNVEVRLDDFCSYGERRGEDE